MVQILLFSFFGRLLLDLGACWDKGLDSDLDQGLTIILTNKLPCITGFFANERCFYIYVSSVQWGIGYLQFSFMFSMHVFISPSLLHLKCYSRLLYNSFDFVYFVFIWKHLYLLHFTSMWFHLPFKVVLKIFPGARALLKQVQDYLVTTILGFDKSIVWRL